MKMLLFFVTGIATLSLLAPISSFAEPTHPNEIGLYLTEDGTGPTGIYPDIYPFFVYLVLTKPTNTESGNPITTLTAFECQLNIHPSGTLFLLWHGLPGEGVNQGSYDGPFITYSEYIVDFTMGLPVSGDSVVLVLFHLLSSGPAEVGFTLTPVNHSGSPNIPGQMSFESGDGRLEIMHPVSGSHEAPVFLVNGEAIPVEYGSFGSVKALYR